MSQQVSVPKNHKHGTIFRAPERIVNALLEQDRIHYTDKRWQIILKYSADGRKWSRGVAQSGDRLHLRIRN